MSMFFQLIRQALRDISLNPWAQILTLAAVTLVSFLVGLGLMIVTTLDHQLSISKGETVFQVYWRPSADPQSIAEQWDGIRQLPGFFHIKTFTPAEALRELEGRIGRGSSAKNFPFLRDQNPLPATALITFTPDEQDYERWLREITSYLAGLEGAERVSSSPLRDEIGQAWRKVNSYVLRPAIIFLTLILGLVVGNTVRLAMLSKAREVEILRLVGAFNWYIRIPLLIVGGLQGLVGSAMSLFILRFLHLHVEHILNFPPILLEIRFPPLQIVLLMLAVPTLLGVAGSWVGLGQPPSGRAFRRASHASVSDKAWEQ
ncbi:MAG: permease [Desulfovibrionaceae bacterium]|nr:permease [Desulfovibrionaceae bacterium]